MRDVSPDDPLDLDEIKAIIPHREPFLLVDRITDMVSGVSAVGELDITDDMFWVPGHFPEFAVMPGVLIVEALAQVGAVALLSLPENEGKLAFFAGIDKVRFKEKVCPGDVLQLEVKITRTRGPIGWGEAKASLITGGNYDAVKVACTGELMFAIK